jgi:hypothetical protein
LNEPVRIRDGVEAPVKRTVFRLLDLVLAIALSLAIASAGRVRAAEPPQIRESDTLWPVASVRGPHSALRAHPAGEGDVLRGDQRVANSE